MKVLLTGATGFIGSHLLESLINNNYEVIILKRSNSKLWRISKLLDQCKCYDIDNINLENIFKEQEISIIIHLATYYIKNHSYTDIEKLIDSNIKFPSLLLELAIKFNVSKFINTGTFFEYDLNITTITEKSQTKPLNFYAVTKIAFEQILNQAVSAKKVRGSTLKIFTPYGPKDDENKLIPHLVTKLMKGNEVSIGNPGQELRAIHVDDIVNAYLKVITLVSETHEVFNIHGDSITIGKIVEKIHSEIKNGKVYTGKNEPIYINADNSFTRERLGWHPTVTFENGIKNLIIYYQGQSNGNS